MPTTNEPRFLAVFDDERERSHYDNKFGLFENFAPEGLQRMHRARWLG